VERASLADLQLRWYEHVVFGSMVSPEEFGELPGSPRPRCWFGDNVPGIDSCEHGPRGIEGAHWIKRQRVERWVKGLGDGPDLVDRLAWSIVAPDFVELAAWDPRNGVPACEKHHRRFDGPRVDATNELIVWRHEVPAPVESFCLDWGLETALEDRNPTIGGGI